MSLCWWAFPPRRWSCSFRPGTWRISRESKLAFHWDDAEAYQFRRSSWTGSKIRVKTRPRFFRTEPDDPEGIERARRASERLRSARVRNWRLREEVRSSASSRSGGSRALASGASISLLPGSLRTAETPRKIGDAHEIFSSTWTVRASLSAFIDLGDRLNKKLGLETSKPAVPAGICGTVESGGPDAGTVGLALAQRLSDGYRRGVRFRSALGGSAGGASRLTSTRIGRSGRLCGSPIP